MRILHALSQTELTGSEAYALDLVKYQNAQGHWTLTVSDRFHMPFPGERQALPLSTGSFWLRMRNILKLRHWLLEHKVEVIHCHSRGACRHLFWARWGLGIPILTTVHGYQHSSMSKRLFHIYGDYVLTVCEKIRDQMVKTMRTKPYAIEVLRNPIRFSEPTPVPPGQTTRRFLLAGRSSGPKGRRLKKIFEHWAQHKSDWPEDVQVHLILSGLDAKERERLRSLWPEALIEGHIPSLQQSIQSATAVLASGRIALEALAMDRRVFALGESSQPGFLSAHNLTEILSSNFGDVGPEQNLDLETIFHAVIQELKNSTLEKQQQIKAVLTEAFTAERIQQRILELYRGLRLFKKAKALPILMYHKVVDQEPQTPHRTFILESNFIKHLKFLKNFGFESLSFKELSDFWWERRPLSEFPKKPVIITFDDGYRNNLRRAAPHLKAFNLKTEIFLLADPEIVRNTWDPDEGDESSALMTMAEKLQLPRPPYSIGSHGLTHKAFPNLNEGQILAELRESKKRLEADFATQVVAFAYPFGALDDRLPGLANQAGYDFAVNTDQGPVYWFTNRHSLFRINIFPQDGVFTLWRKTSSWYRESYFKKRGR